MRRKEAPACGTICWEVPELKMKGLSGRRHLEQADWRMTDKKNKGRRGNLGHLVKDL